MTAGQPTGAEPVRRYGRGASGQEARLWLFGTWNGRGTDGKALPYGLPLKE